MLAVAPAPSASLGPPAQVVAPAPPQPVALASTAGDPNAAAVMEARLVAKSCADGEQALRDVLHQRVEAMLADVDEAFRQWRSLPACDPSLPIIREGSVAITGSAEGYGAGFHGSGGLALGGARTEYGHDRLEGEGAAHARSASGTNNQVAGVDEADMVKNDGRYVYLASNGALRIIAALPPHLLSVTNVPGTVREILLSGDRAVVLSSRGGSGVERGCTYGYDCAFAGDGTATTITVLDVANRNHPTTVRRIDFSGSLIAARRIGSTVHVVVADNDVPAPDYETSPSDLPYCYRDAAGVQAEFDRLKRDNERKILALRPTFPTVTEGGVKRRLCDVLHSHFGDGQAFTTVASFGVHDDRSLATVVTMQSRPGAVYASEDHLYVSVGHQRSGNGRWYGFYGAQSELSDVHGFRIGATPAETRYEGSGVVPGHVLNQFSIDAWNGHLRIATTRGRVPDPDADNLVSVLTTTAEGNLVRTGAVDRIAPQEDIRAVRFDGDRGYVVTFKKTDPLYVLDLHDAAAPRTLGELKIPGFSTYLHRLDASHLLSIGFDANDHGDFAYFDGLILQIFDVTRPTEPALLFKEKIGTRGSSSEAATDHLAFNYFAEHNLLALPATICEGGGDGTFGDRLAFSGLLVYEVTTERGFRRLGGVDHGKAGAACGTWWSAAASSVKRSLFMDDLVFSIASDRMKVQRLAKLGEDVADIAMQ
jgi:hypothetical protein